MNQHTQEFWSLLDRLCKEHQIIIDRPKGSAHPRYPDFIYPLDYGYIKDTRSPDGGGIDVWIGSKEQDEVCGIIACIDYVKRDSEIKVLIACTDQEIQTVLVETNRHDGMKGVLVRREPPLNTQYC